jgi:hypothetical protein
MKNNFYLWGLNLIKVYILFESDFVPLENSNNLLL